MKPSNPESPPQAHAAAAVVNFSEGAEADLMAPHLDTLITHLLTLLQRGKKLVQVGRVRQSGAVRGQRARPGRPRRSD
jgi:hypothetical protein